eukprot:CAMPEP_0206245972 /NCGR_PEP_ID=MMETSP0047_2-20121206/18993_1 /ASSEMBLY_ACC=CAM_ASM_000192 /TAXON_ID=195065 /ORGANISM="Chroomonas mesostigmatica_cf, Strain CCMP1168" /LENGTH=212 /DNA_ID=CAMNT_0053671329 /DNA_START=313 /DNA_END=952 /DNA_ORIENTATION=-
MARSNSLAHAPREYSGHMVPGHVRHVPAGHVLRGAHVGELGPLAALHVPAGCHVRQTTCSEASSEIEDLAHVPQVHCVHVPFGHVPSDHVIRGGRGRRAWPTCRKHIVVTCLLATCSEASSEIEELGPLAALHIEDRGREGERRKGGQQLLAVGGPRVGVVVQVTHRRLKGGLQHLRVILEEPHDDGPHPSSEVGVRVVEGVLAERLDPLLR